MIIIMFYVSYYNQFIKKIISTINQIVESVGEYININVKLMNVD